MRRLIAFILAAVCAVCAAQAQPVIYGTAEDMEAVKKYKVDKRGYEACIKKKVAPFQTQAEALSKKIKSAENEINQMYQNSVNTPLDTNKISQKQKNLDGLKKQKADLDGKIEANTQACQTQFPAREWHGIVDVAAMERQGNFNRSVLELLRNGDLSKLEDFLDSFPRVESCRDGHTPPKGTVVAYNKVLSYPRTTVELEHYDAIHYTCGFEERTYYYEGYERITYPTVSIQGALWYGLTTCYKELYGEDVKVKNVAHYRDFVKRFPIGAAASLITWHATGMYDIGDAYGIIESAMRKDNYEKAGRFAMWASYGMDIVNKGDRVSALSIRLDLQDILGYYTARETPEYFGEEFSRKLKRFLDGAYGESVKLNAKGIFHQLKRDLLHTMLEDNKYHGPIMLANGGFELLAIKPITRWEIERVTQIVEQCRQIKLPNYDPKYDTDEDRWNKVMLKRVCGPFKKAATQYGYYQDVSTTVQRDVRQTMQNRKSASKK